MSDADERLTTIWQHTVSALQGVVRDLKISEHELMIAGRYFNRLGVSGMFPSLLAVGLAMTSIDATEAGEGGTRPNLEGPFHKANPPLREDGVLIDKSPGPEARILYLSGKITDSRTGRVLPGAELDIWQADENGTYDEVGYNLRGVVRANGDGVYKVTTIVPKDYAEHDNDPIGELFRAMERHNRRAAHIHLKARAPGYRPLTTQLFVPNTNHLFDDYVEGAVSDDLVLHLKEMPRRPEKHPEFAATFDFALRPAQQSAAPAPCPGR
jgi:protocatechuate 3,4-dioxygenase beta subunit